MAGELSDDGWVRLVRRVRRLDGEARKVADRLVEHVHAVEQDRRWLRKDAASTHSWGSAQADEAHRLRERCSLIYGVLTAEQREELRAKDEAARAQAPAPVEEETGG